MITHIFACKYTVANSREKVLQTKKYIQTYIQIYRNKYNYTYKKIRLLYHLWNIIAITMWCEIQYEQDKKITIKGIKTYEDTYTMPVILTCRSTTQFTGTKFLQRTSQEKT